MDFALFICIAAFMAMVLHNVLKEPSKKFYWPKRDWDPRPTVLILAINHPQYREWVRAEGDEEMFRYVYISDERSGLGYMADDLIVLEGAEERPYFKEFHAAAMARLSVRPE